MFPDDEQQTFSTSSHHNNVDSLCKLNKCEGVSNISYRSIRVLLSWLRMKQHVVHEQEDARKMNKIYNCILGGMGRQLHGNE